MGASDTDGGRGRARRDTVTVWPVGADREKSWSPRPQRARSPHRCVAPQLVQVQGPPETGSTRPSTAAHAHTAGFKGSTMGSVVGIDVHKTTLEIAEHGGRQWQRPRTAAGLARLVEELRARR